MSGGLSQSFKGKIAVVTGSTQGLGEAVARLFADSGLSGLVICGRNQSTGKEVASVRMSHTLCSGRSGPG